MPYKKTIRDVTKAAQQSKPMTKGLSGPAWMAARSGRRDMYSGIGSELSSRQESYERQLMSQRQAQEEEGEYERVRADDGGWNFFDPQGNPVPAAEYATAAGQTLPWALSGSENQDDTAFMSKFKALKDIVSQANANMMEKSLDEPRLYDPKTKKYYKLGFDPKVKLQELAQQYPHVYGGYLNRNQ